MPRRAFLLLAAMVSTLRAQFATQQHTWRRIIGHGWALDGDTDAPEMVLKLIGTRDDGKTFQVRESFPAHQDSPWMREAQGRVAWARLDKWLWRE